MPNLQRGSSRRSGGGAIVRDSSSEASESDNEEQGRLNDSLLQKVNPEYLNQPIDAKQGDLKLKLLCSQFEQTKKQLEEARALLHNVASDFTESLAEEVLREEEFDEDKYIGFLLENETMKALDREFRTILDRIQETSIRSQIISDIRQRLVQGHPMTNMFETYQTRADKALADYETKSQRERFVKHKDYLDFISLIWENFSGGTAVPNIKKFLPREAAANGAGENGADGGAAAGSGGEDSDEELEIGAQSTDFRCPLTAAILEDPYTSTLCPHSFSGEAIKSYIAQSRGSVVCPVAGCHQKLDLGKIERDEGLKRRVEAHLRRVQSGATQLGATNGEGGGGGATGGRTYVEMSDSEED
ncbi:SUMO ligase MMS21 [Sporobolomyces salmoneus]|uniref:SUMO ligase MMS21 n=1 Tax=Sporobolomyces salmoneus TaxID=183962 RepID=UPI00316FC450